MGSFGKRIIGEIIVAATPNKLNKRNASLSGTNFRIYDSTAGPAIRLTLSATVYSDSILSRVLMSLKRLAEVMMFGIIKPRTAPLATPSSQTEKVLESQKPTKINVYMKVEVINANLLCPGFNLVFRKAVVRKPAADIKASIIPTSVSLNPKEYFVRRGTVVMSMLLLALIMNVMTRIMKAASITNSFELSFN
jgi:hypothetical protein